MNKKRQAEFVLWMGPLLDVLRELGDSATPQEASDLVALKCGVSDQKKEELLESGQAKFPGALCGQLCSKGDREKTLVLLIRKKSVPDVPYMTIEIFKNILREARKRKNALPDNTDKEYLKALCRLNGWQYGI